MKKRKIWLLEGPFTRYKENVKELATAEDLSLLDSRWAVGVDGEKKVPKVTLKGEKKPAKKAPKEPEAPAVNQE